jgi:hypothetical protein
MRNLHSVRDLPNRDGFVFIGVNGEGKEALCIVRQDPKTKCHYVDGLIKLCDLTGWRYKEAE